MADTRLLAAPKRRPDGADPPITLWETASVWRDADVPRLLAATTDPKRAKAIAGRQGGGMVIKHGGAARSAFSPSEARRGTASAPRRS